MRAKTLMRSVVILMTLASALSHGEEKEASKDPLAGLNIIEHQPSPLEKAVSQAGDQHFKAMQVVNAAYRKDLAAALGTATEIEIYLLDFALGVMTFAYSGLLGVYFTLLFTTRGSAASVIA